jgi:hypothetical protein
VLPGGARSQGATSQVMAQLLQTSRCLHAHGVTGFPDPTSSPPVNQAAYGGIIGFSAPNAPPVAYLPVPKSIDPNSPAAEQAANACHFRLR